MYSSYNRAYELHFYKSTTDWNRMEIVETFVKAVMWYIFIAIVVLIFTHFVPVSDSSATVGTVEVASKAYGLTSGKEYKFRYGRIASGSGGYAAAHGGLFSSSAVVNLKPSSAMDVSFSNGKNSYILELPFKNIKFIPTTKEKPSLTIYLSDIEYGETDLRVKQRVYHWKYIPHYTTPGKTLEESGWFQYIKKEGQLAPFVDEYFESAVIKLNPKDYSRILGE